jgi:ABC-type glycerol-3-phosphate transport system substrate-binding protein
MKKVLFAAVVALTLGLTACGNGASKTETATDSTAVDTTAVTAVDTTTAQITADTASTFTKEVK